jgi:hypothetical protein
MRSIDKEASLPKNFNKKWEINSPTDLPSLFAFLKNLISLKTLNKTQSEEIKLIDEICDTGCDNFFPKESLPSLEQFCVKHPEEKVTRNHCLICGDKVEYGIKATSIGESIFQAVSFMSDIQFQKLLDNSNNLKRMSLEEFMKDTHNIDEPFTGLDSCIINEVGFFRGVDICFLILVTSDGVTIRDKGKSIKKVIIMWGMNLTAPGDF